MDMKKIKSAIGALSLVAVATFGLSACDKGTEPGETNVERSDIVKTRAPEKVEIENDSTDPERFYDNEYRKGKKGAVHAGDGIKEGVGRDDVKKN
jgi:hypothetical protein